MEQIAVISIVCRNDLKEAAKISGRLDLNENELAILMGVPKKDKIITEIIEKSQEFRQKREVVTLDYRPILHNDEDDEPKKITPKADSKQKSLFEF